MVKWFGVVVVAGLAMSIGRADRPATGVGKTIAPFQLKDTAGKSIDSAEFREKKVLVVVFVGTQCPLNNLYFPRLAELHREFAPRGVQFLAVNSNSQDTLDEIAEHARKHETPFPVLKDAGNVVADAFGARRTPEAFVLDEKRVVRYQGRIDDQYGIGVQRARPTRQELRDAIEAVLAGKEVPTPAVAAEGCIIGRVARPRESGTVTFARHVAPLLQKHCQQCHRPGQIGPMPLLKYQDATAWAETIREVIQDRRMPPWHADPRHGRFSNDRRLSDADRQTFLEWIEQGLVKGDTKDLPPPREFAEGWTIGKPDVVFTMPREYAVPAQMPRGGIPYQEFFVDTGFKEDRWVVGAEARPGAPEVVHHIVVFIVPPGKQFFPGNPETPVLAGTAPGDIAYLMPPESGMAKKIPAGSRLVFQMHYTPNGRAQKDRSSLGLILARQAPKYSLLTVPIADLTFRIPPGAAQHKVEAWFRFRHDGKVVALMPHMHLRGKDFLVEAVYPDGKTEVLLSVPRYDFNWQQAYMLARPHSVPRGTRIHCVAHFDNSPQNPNNPDPTQTVTWGDQTWEEMMIGWMDYVYEKK